MLQLVAFFQLNLINLIFKWDCASVIEVTQFIGLFTYPIIIIINYNEYLIGLITYITS